MGYNSGFKGLNFVKHLFLVIGTDFVFCELGGKFLYMILMNVILQSVNLLKPAGYVMHQQV